MSLFISSGYCAALAVMILILPLDWIIPAMSAAFIHELCHYLAILLCAGQTKQLQVYTFAARMELPVMGRGKELLCALAGPMGGFLLYLLNPWLPRLAVCALIQSLYNLLPIYPLDGGRALRCLLQMLLSPAAAQFAEAFVQWLTIGAAFLLALYAFAVLQLGMLPLLVVVVLVFRAKDAKMPCNAKLFAVQ